MRHAFSLAAVLLIALGVLPCAAASADQPFPASHDSRLREQMRAIQMEQAMLQREHARDERSVQGSDSAQQEPAASQNLPHSDLQSAAEESPRANRMTPEERRALRRQIDDAGHEIYTPR